MHSDHIECTDVLGRKRQFVVPKPIDAEEFRPLMSYAAKARNEIVPVEMPIVRVLPSLQLQHTVGRGTRGALMPIDPPQVWLNDILSGVDRDSTLVHEFVHYLQFRDIAWDFRAVFINPQRHLDVEIEAHLIQRQFLLDHNVHHHQLTRYSEEWVRQAVIDTYSPNIYSIAENMFMAEAGK